MARQGLTSPSLCQWGSFCPITQALSLGRPGWVPTWVPTPPTAPVVAVIVCWDTFSFTESVLFMLTEGRGGFYDLVCK